MIGIAVVLAGCSSSGTDAVEAEGDCGAELVWSETTYEGADVARSLAEAQELGNGFLPECPPEAERTVSVASIRGIDPSIAVMTPGPPDAYDAKGYSASCPAGRLDFDLTEMVRNWIKNPSTHPNHGLELRANDETSNSGWKKFNSMEATYTPAYLSIAYNSYPAVVAGSLLPASGATEANQRPSFGATYSDEDGDDGRVLYDGDNLRRFKACNVDRLTFEADLFLRRTYRRNGSFSWLGGGLRHAGSNLPSDYRDTSFDDPGTLQSVSMGSSHARSIKAGRLYWTYVETPLNNANRRNRLAQGNAFADAQAGKVRSCPLVSIVYCIFSIDTFRYFGPTAEFSFPGKHRWVGSDPQ